MLFVGSRYLKSPVDRTKPKSMYLIFPNPFKNNSLTYSREHFNNVVF